MALNPEVRLERFLAGQNLTPAVRLEYFLAGAAGYGLAALQDEAPAIAAGGTAVATIPDAADNVPLQSLLVQVNPLQEGTGTPSPDNERPIVTRDSVELFITGGNNLTEERTASAKLPEDFYGGTVDIVRGIATKKYAKIDMGSLEWTGTGETRFFGQISNIVKNSVCYCSQLVTATYSDVYNHVVTDSIAVHPNAQQVEVYMPEYSSPIDFAEAMVGVELCYEVTDPVEITIDPVTILTLHGVNNFSADTGNVLAIEYKQDPEASANEIKALIAPVLPEMKADANLVANDFRIVGNTLYKITASIAAGGTLTPGSNCTATTVGAQLKALL